MLNVLCPATTEHNSLKREKKENFNEKLLQWCIMGVGSAWSHNFHEYSRAREKIGDAAQQSELEP